MSVYNSLRNIAHYMSFLRGVFHDLGYSIRNVYIVGQYMTVWFYNISNFFGYVESEFYDMAGDWLNFYDWIRDNISIDGVLRDIIRYADDLLSFIRSPFEWIWDTIRDYSRDLYEMANDPIAYILEVLYRYTGLGYDFIHNPRGIVREMIDDMLGGVRDIIRDPRGWVLDILQNISPAFVEILYNPLDWVQDKIRETFPYAIDFLHDPDGYLEERIMDVLERAGEKYLSRVLKLAERILQAIF